MIDRTESAACCRISARLGTVFVLVAFGILAAGTSSAVNHAPLESTVLDSGNSPIELATPPGVDPSEFRRRTSEETAAWKSLEEVLLELDHEVSLPPAPTQAFLPREDVVQAQQLYARARQDLTNGDAQSAMNWLQQLLRLDPGAVEGWRTLAQAAYLLSNVGLAEEAWVRILSVDRNDTEALINLGALALARRDIAKAAWCLASARRILDPTVDAARRVVVDHLLADALRESGYDRAFIELGESIDSNDVTASPGDRFIEARLGEIFRRRSEHWRSIGDAHVRLNELDAARLCYTRSAALPSPDPSLLRTRTVYVLLCDGRPEEAQNEFLAAVASDPEHASQNDVALASYLRRVCPDTTRLTQAVDELLSAHSTQPAIVRIAAELSAPDQAIEILRTYALRCPDDLSVVGDLLRFLADRDLDAAAALAAELVKSNPGIASSVASTFSALPKAPRELRTAMESQINSPERAAMAARLAAVMRDLGRAWRLVEAADSRWPDSVPLLEARVDVATALEEPALITDSIKRAATAEDPRLKASIVELLLGAGAKTEALEFADSSLLVHPAETGLLLAAARVRLQIAREAPADRREQRAADAAEAIVSLRALNPRPHEVDQLLIEFHDPRSGIQPDPTATRDAVIHLRAAEPDSAFLQMLLATEEVSQRRTDDAIDRLLQLYQKNPADATAISLLIEAWTRDRKTKEALQWIDTHLETSPSDPNLLDAKISLLLRLDQAQEARRFLEQRLDSDPDDSTSLWLLERVYRSLKLTDDFARVARQRVTPRPEGPRKSLTLAAIALQEGNVDAAAKNLMDAAQDAEGSPLLAGSLGEIGLGLSLIHEGAAREAAAAIEQAFTGDADAPWNWLATAMALHQHAGAADPQLRVVAALADHRLSRIDRPTLDLANEWLIQAQSLAQRQAWSAAAVWLMKLLETPGTVESLVYDDLSRAALACEAAQGGRIQVSMDFVQRQVAGGRVPLAESTTDQPDFASALYRLSNLYSMMGDTAGSRAALERSLEIDPGGTMAMNNLAYSQIDAGVSDSRWVEMAEAALARLPENESILDTVGWLRYRQGRFDEAFALISQARDRTERASSIEVLDHLGDTLWRLGRKTEALEAWRNAVQIIDQNFTRRQMVQTLIQFQQREYRIVVVDPERLYDRIYGDAYRRIGDKIHAAADGRNPSIAPLFTELESLPQKEQSSGRP